MSDNLPFYCIYGMLFIVAVLMVCLWRRQANHNRLYIYLFGTMFSSKLLTLTAILELCMDWLSAPDEASRPKGFAIDTVLSMDLEEQEADFLYLIGENALGNGAKKRLRSGFDSFAQALILMRSIPPENLEKGELTAAEQQKICECLAAAVKDLQRLRRNVIC